MDILYSWTKLNEKQQAKMRAAIERQPFMLDFGDRQMCVVKMEEGFYAMSNNCPHAGVQLHMGACNKKGVLTCPAHGYKFDVHSGRSADGSGYMLKTFRIREENGEYFVGSRRY